MAGRKRKMLVSAAPELVVVNHESKRCVRLPPGLGSEVTPTRSQYFIKNQEHRLGEDFFNQPCVSLAKAFLGKVSSHFIQFHQASYVPVDDVG